MNQTKIAMTSAATCALLVLAAAPAGAAGWETRNVAGMSTHVYTPDAAGAAGSGRALIVFLHGCVQQNDSLRDRGNWEPAAEAYGVVVALPQVPNGGVLAGCWDYYGSNHRRGNRHNRYVLDLVDQLLADGGLGIDPRQVYVGGLSSGGGEAAVLGCLAPDVFTGTAINAGPAVGTTQSQFVVVGTTVAQAKSQCERLAGQYVSDLSAQVAAVIAGTSDFVVAQGYADLNAEMYAELAGGGLRESTFDPSQLEGAGTPGDGKLWSDPGGPRVSRILVDGLDHAFPAGTGQGFTQGYVSPQGPAWPLYLARFFAENNPRISSRPPPDGGQPPPGSDGGASDPDGGAGSAADVGAGSDPDGGSAGDSDGGAGSAADGGASGDSDPGDREGGCRCVAGPGGASAPWLLALGLFARLGRRGRASRGAGPRPRCRGRAPSGSRRR